MPSSKKNSQKKVKKTGRLNSKISVNQSEELKQLKQGIRDSHNYFFPSEEELGKSLGLLKPLIPLIPELQPTLEEIIDHQITTEQNKIEFAFLMLVQLSFKFHRIFGIRESVLSMCDSLNGRNFGSLFLEDQVTTSKELLKSGKEEIFRFNYELNKLLEENSIKLSKNNID